MNRRPLTDAQWALVRLFVLTDPRRGGRPPVDHRRGVDATLWALRTGSPWRDLPPTLGSWRSAYSAFRRWTRRSVRRRLLAGLAGERDCSAYLIGSTVVRARQHAPGAKKAARTRPSAAPAAGPRPRSTPWRTRGVAPWTRA